VESRSLKDVYRDTDDLISVDMSDVDDGKREGVNAIEKDFSYLRLEVLLSSDGEREAWRSP
jgi:hypothetical protein